MIQITSELGDLGQIREFTSELGTGKVEYIRRGFPFTDCVFLFFVFNSCN